MTDGTDQDRRRFVVSLATLAGGLGCALVITRCSLAPGERPLVLDVSEILTVRDDARIVGGAYLEQAPDENDRPAGASGAAGRVGRISPGEPAP